MCQLDICLIRTFGCLGAGNAPMVLLVCPGFLVPPTSTATRSWRFRAATCWNPVLHQSCLVGNSVPFNTLASRCGLAILVRSAVELLMLEALLWPAAHPTTPFHCRTCPWNYPTAICSAPCRIPSQVATCQMVSISPGSSYGNALTAGKEHPLSCATSEMDVWRLMSLLAVCPSHLDDDFELFGLWKRTRNTFG